MNKRLVVALGVWFVLILVWQVVFVKPQKPQPVDTSKKVAEKATAAKKVAKPYLISEKVSEKDKLVTIQTKKFKIGLKNSSGSMYSLKFKEYKDGGKLIDFVEKNLKYYGNFRVLLNGLSDADQQKVVNFSSKKVGPLEYVLQAKLKNGIINSMMTNIILTFKLI